MPVASVSPALAHEFDESPTPRFNIPNSVGAGPNVGVSISPEGLESYVGPVGESAYRDAAGMDDMLARTAAAVERFPRSVRARVDYALAMLSDGRVGEAIGELKAALSIRPTDPGARVHLAQALIVADRLGEAHQLLDELAGVTSVRRTVDYLRAEVAMHEGDIPTALGVLRDLVGADPESSRANAFLGVVLAGSGAADEGVHYLRRATRLNANSPGLHAALGMAYALAGRPEKAVRALETARFLAPSMPEAQRALAQVLARGGHLSHAAGLLRTRIEEDSEDEEALEVLAEVEHRQGRTREALALLTRVLDRSPARSDSWRILNNLAILNWSLRRTAQASRQFSEAVRLLPKNPIPYQNYARLLYEEGDTESALAVLHRAELAFPGDPTNRILVALCREAQGRYEEAVLDLRRWTAQGEAPPSAWSALGQLLTDAMESPDEAISVLREGAARFPHDALILNNLAYALLMTGRPIEARDVLRRASEVRPPIPSIEHAVLSATSGLLALHEGNWEDGRTGYLAAIQEARALGNRPLEMAARQKMHLEFGRAWIRSAEPTRALHEFRAGLATKGEGLYKRHLERAVEVVRHSLALPESESPSDGP